MLGLRDMIKQASAEYFEPVLYVRDLFVGGKGFARAASSLRGEINSTPSNTPKRSELVDRYKGLRQTHSLQ